MKNLIWKTNIKIDIIELVLMKSWKANIKMTDYD